MASAKLSNFNTNQFRLETVSSDTAGPGRTVTVNLPENAILDLKSFKMNLDILTTQATVGGVTVFGRLPADLPISRGLNVMSMGFKCSRALRSTTQSLAS